jgi:HEXXH motif-containing protein
VNVDIRGFADGISFHRLPWLDFDKAALGQFDIDMVSQLRTAERSRRLLLLRALVDEVGKMPELAGPLPSPEEAWELLARVEMRSPATFNSVLAYPYTGSWAGYTTRLLRGKIAGICPLWMHIGHLHALAATAAIRSGLDFTMTIPLWEGTAILPSLGAIRLKSSRPDSVAHIHGVNQEYVVGNEYGQFPLPDVLGSDAPGWWGVRSAMTEAGTHRIEVRLDDLDPYRGLYEPILPQRLAHGEIEKWRRLLGDAWMLLVDRLPDRAGAFSAAIDALVPRPEMPFRNPSASTGEAFGSAVLARPSDSSALAATLVHEFRHMILGGILHLVPLYSDDMRERYYVPWRDDPRPLSLALQGVYAFAGVAEFWRTMINLKDENLTLRAEFEFAYWRGESWRVVNALRQDKNLTEAGQRFLHGIASNLRPWQDEQVSAGAAYWAGVIAADHYAGWRIRHVRPDQRTVGVLADAWLAGRRRPPSVQVASDTVPTPVPDGQWSGARVDLIRLRRGGVEDDSPSSTRPTVPSATIADIAFASGRSREAAHGYHLELVRDPDSPTAWVGLGLALAEAAAAASRVLLKHPELVRSVYRQIHVRQVKPPAPADLATWIGQAVN